MEILGLSDSTQRARHWLLELLWPSVDSEVAAETAARNGLWVCLILGVLSAVAVAIAGRFAVAGLIGGVLLFLYFVVLAIGVGAGSRLACVVAIAYILFSVGLSVVTNQFGLPVVPIIAIGLLMGGLRAAVALRNFRRQQATSTALPDLPESVYRELAPEHLRRMAEVDDRGLLTRLVHLWRRISPGGEIILTGLTFLYFGLMVLGLLATRGVHRPTLR